MSYKKYICILLLVTFFIFGGVSASSTYLGDYSQNLVFLDHFNTSGINLLYQMGSCVVLFLPQLISTFHCPSQLAAVIQAMIYVCYAWSLLQFLTGRMGGVIQ